MAPSLTSAKRRDHQSGITLVELLVTMVVLTIVTTMIIVSWFTLQSSYAQTAAANDARSSARDALNRMSMEIRSAQAPASSTTGAVFVAVPPSTGAMPTEVDFYSSFNVAGQSSNGSATGALLLTRIYLGGTMPYQTLYLQRDTNNSATFDSGDQSIVLANNVVNNSFPSTGAPTPVFAYGYRDSSNQFQTANTIPSASLPSTITLASIVSVTIRVMVDANLNHTPLPVDLQTIVRPQNAPQS
jgi:Tfp pilus assembly protein PilW